MGDQQFICRALTQGTTASFKGHSRTLAQATCSADASAIRVGVGTLEAAGPTSAVAPTAIARYWVLCRCHRPTSRKSFVCATAHGRIGRRPVSSFAPVVGRSR